MRGKILRTLKIPIAAISDFRKWHMPIDRKKTVWKAIFTHERSEDDRQDKTKRKGDFYEKGVIDDNGNLHSAFTML